MMPEAAWRPGRNVLWPDWSGVSPGAGKNKGDDTMFLELTKKYGKPICVALYAWYAVLAAKKKPIHLLLLFLMHATEYMVIGRKTAQENGLSAAEGLAQCLAFGFTWWLPLKKG